MVHSYRFPGRRPDSSACRLLIGATWGAALHLAPFLPGHPGVPTGGTQAIDAVTASPWGSASQSHAWAAAGVFEIKAQARCAADPAMVSAWSGPLRSVRVDCLTLTLNVAPAGAGSVAANPNKTCYSWVESEVLTAAANAPYAFSSWSGDASGTANTLTLTMDGNKNVTANFSAQQNCADFVTGVTTYGSLQNNQSRWLGMRLRVGSSPLQVTSLGRTRRAPPEGRPIT